MAWDDANELVVASKGEIYVGEVGATLPTDPTTALPVATWTGLGFVSEDGVALSVAPEIESFMAWQSRQAVRREFVAQAITASFELEQWSSDNIILAFGGGQITSPSAGVFKYEFPDADDALDERAMVIDWSDGDKHYRAVFPRGNVSDEVETNLNRSNLALLPITFEILAPDGGGSPGYVVSDDPAWDPAGS